MADGYAVDRAALAETAQGLNGVIGQLKGLGLSETGDVGRGFSELELSGLQAGNEDVASAFGSFCDRWPWSGPVLTRMSALLRGVAVQDQVEVQVLRPPS